jgi:hypothetical protein
MKQNDVNRLKNGDKVTHSQYGLCSVDEVMMSFGSFFGLVLIPETIEGKIKLACDSGTTIPKFLEDSIRRVRPPLK